MQVDKDRAQDVMREVYGQVRALVEATLAAEGNRPHTVLGIIEGLATALACVAAPHMSREGFVEAMRQHYREARANHVEARLKSECSALQRTKGPPQPPPLR